MKGTQYCGYGVCWWRWEVQKCMHPITCQCNVHGGVVNAVCPDQSCCPSGAICKETASVGLHFLSAFAMCFEFDFCWSVWICSPAPVGAAESLGCWDCSAVSPRGKGVPKGDLWRGGPLEVCRGGPAVHPGP